LGAGSDSSYEGNLKYHNTTEYSGRKPVLQGSFTCRAEKLYEAFYCKN